MIAKRDDQERGRSTTDVLLLVTLAAAVTELIFLRTATRMAIHIPGIDAVATPYQVASSAAEYAFYLSAISVACWVAVAAAMLWARGTARLRLGAGALGLFLVAAAVGRAGFLDQSLLDATTCGAVAVCAGLLAGQGSVWRAAIAIAYSVAFLVLAAPTIFQWTINDATPALLSVGEAATLIFGVLAPVAFGVRITRRSVLAWGAIGIAIAVMLSTASGSSLRILLLWNEGLTGTLAPALYGIAGGGLLVALVGLARGGRLWEFVGVALLLAGGVGLHSTQQSALVLAGLTALILAPPNSYVALPAIPMSPRKVSSRGRELAA